MRHHVLICPRGGPRRSRVRFRGILSRVLVGVLTLLWGVPWAETGGGVMPPITLTHADHKAHITVGPGAVLLIRLDENPTTGYRWHLEAHDTAVLAVHSNTYVATPSDGMGGGGHRLVTLQAVKAGRVHLQLTHGRAWEADTANAKQFTVTIYVHE